MKRLPLFLALCWPFLFFLTGCEKERPAADPFPFELLREDRTGLDFRNTPTLNAEFNVFNYMYFYNGGGLAAGDFNGDGRVDLYFTSNQDANRLYLNDGEMQFRDVTEAAGVKGQPGWTTGATVVDINNDGLLDIYVSQVGDYLHLKGTNQLYVNQGVRDGVPVFRDEAADYGLDLVGFGTQGAFFDYDGDGDLDLYQLNHSLHQNGTFGKRENKAGEVHPLAGDRLLRNDGARFTDVTATAGITSSVVGYGLGVVTGDLNADGWPDIYVGNDFHENDYLYLNNRDGTFREALTERMAHTSRFSMGVDIADINNDGHPEVFSLDMLPEDPYILKSSLGEDGFDIFRFKLGFGYNPQFSRNALQLNNGDGTFSEIGAYAGVYASDWSWAPLFFDVDDDGKRDLFVSNGIPRRMNDIDYINFKTNDADHRFRSENNRVEDDDLAWIERMPEIKLTNKFYHNRGDLTFADRSDDVAGAAVSYSSSAVYADLDNDGDLDVVVNNIDDEPFVYRNLTRDSLGATAGASKGTKSGDYLALNLTGQPTNLNAIGATAVVFSGNDRMVYERYPTRGYQAGVLEPLHVSLGDAARVDSVLLIWPDRTHQRIPVSDYNLTLDLRWQPGLPRFNFSRLPTPPGEALPLYDATAEIGLDFVHEENPFVDFNRETLMPHMVSAEGPALAVGDVDGDGLEDFFVGSAKRVRSALFRQTPAGGFVLATPEAIVRDSVFEDVDAHFVDLENDGDLDLVVAAGGNEYQKRQDPRRQRAYLNDGAGNFTRQDIFPDLFLTASRILPGDFNGDGLMDFAVTGRVVPWNYGKVPPSYLFRNEGENVFTDVTEELAPELATAGLVTDGQWADVDGDGDQDLLLAREWEPITIYRNDGGRLRPEEIADDKGWWSRLQAADFDGDGDVDILAGNLGENNKLKPSPDEPVRMYVNDFDDNEKIEQVLTYFVKGQEIPFANHAELTKQLTSLKKKYLYAQDMAKESLTTLFGEDKLAAATRYEINTLSSFYYEQTENGDFRAYPLPAGVQLSSLNAFVRLGNAPEAPVLVGGNFFNSNIEMGWYDAGFLRGLSIGQEGKMAVQPLSGARIGGQVRALRRIRIGDRSAVLVARNDDSLRIIVEGEQVQ